MAPMPGQKNGAALSALSLTVADDQLGGYAVPHHRGYDEIGQRH
jgi:hypothetical protein